MSYKDKDDRKKKSWREIDRKKDSSAHTGSADEREAHLDKMRKSSGAYETYKNDLDKVFNGDEIPDYLKQSLPEGERKGQLNRIGQIKRAHAAKDIAKAVETYVKEYGEFPDDYELLAKVLEVENETYRLQALQVLEKLMDEQPIEHKRQLTLKVESISLLAEDDDLQELAQTLLERLRG